MPLIECKPTVIPAKLLPTGKKAPHTKGVFETASGKRKEATSDGCCADSAEHCLIAEV